MCDRQSLTNIDKT